MANGVTTNGKNGLFLKVIIGALIAGLVAASGGLIKVYRDVGILQETRKADALLEMRLARMEKDVVEVRMLVESINEDRHKRTIIIPQMQADIVELKRAIGRR